MKQRRILTLPNQKTNILIVGVLAGIIIIATTITIISWENILRHQFPEEWIRISNPALETGPEWSWLGGVWAGFNGYHLFLRFEWNSSMESAPLKSSSDYYGNTINAYYGMRGVEVKMDIAGNEAIVSVRQMKDGYWRTSTGVQVITEYPRISDEETKAITLEVAIPALGYGQLWQNLIQWQEVNAYFKFVSGAGVAHISSVPRNSSHTIICDGEITDWKGLSNLTINEGIMANLNDFGAITNVSAIFCSDGLAFMMSTYNAFHEILAAYSTLDLEVTIVFNIEAFQVEPEFFEHSYNPNLNWERIEGHITRSNIVYHLWDAIDPSQLWNEETFEIAMDQWNISTVAELLLLNDEIQPLLEMTPIDYYSLHYSIVLRWYENH